MYAFEGIPGFSISWLIQHSLREFQNSQRDGCLLGDSTFMFPESCQTNLTVQLPYVFAKGWVPFLEFQIPCCFHFGQLYFLHVLNMVFVQNGLLCLLLLVVLRIPIGAGAFRGIPDAFFKMFNCLYLVMFLQLIETTKIN